MAVLANKVGDLTLLIAALLLQYTYKNVSFLDIKGLSFFYENVFELANSNHILISITTDHLNISFYIQNMIADSVFYIPNYVNYGLINTFQVRSFCNTDNFEVIALLLILSSIGKSAQFGFHF